MIVRGNVVIIREEENDKIERNEKKIKKVMEENKDESSKPTLFSFELEIRSRKTPLFPVECLYNPRTPLFPLKS